jgi:exopolyphosphatase/guanosine-5'-triphosphate,3'-diphosphate pyrophosphatase
MTVAVIDIGSNSIKILVAAREAAAPAPVSLFYKTLEARISAGISKANPALTGESMSRGLAAIEELLADAARFAPERTILVATSAVRDASNGGDFRRRVLAATGRDIRILTGAEEAGYIGRGLMCDPALAGLRDFHVFDLGGGSLECLAFRDCAVVRETSLPLGCVRLTEKFVPDPAQPIPPDALRAINAHTKTTLRAAGFAFDLPPPAEAIVTGGTTTTARALIGAAAGNPPEETSPRLALDDMRALLGRVAGADIAARRAMPGMPFGRADVFPTALATIVALAEAAGFAAFQTSLFNLRWGIADEALEK